MAALKLLEMDKSIFIDQLLSNKKFMENKELPENPDKVSERYKEVSTNQVDEDLAENKNKLQKWLLILKDYVVKIQPEISRS